MLAGNVSMDEGTKGKSEYEKAVSLCHCAGALQTRPQVFWWRQLGHPEVFVIHQFHQNVALWFWPGLDLIHPLAWYVIVRVWTIRCFASRWISTNTCIYVQNNKRVINAWHDLTAKYAKLWLQVGSQLSPNGTGNFGVNLPRARNESEELMRWVEWTTRRHSAFTAVFPTGDRLSSYQNKSALGLLRTASQTGSKLSVEEFSSVGFQPSTHNNAFMVQQKIHAYSQLLSLPSFVCTETLSFADWAEKAEIRKRGMGEEMAFPLHIQSPHGNAANQTNNTMTP